MSRGDVNQVEGEPLVARLVAGPLPVREVIAVGAAVADALGATHALGLVHGDLDPARVILRWPPQGSGLPRVELLGRRAAGEARGIHSPEEARGGAGADARSDVFALGALLHQCITGRAVFSGDDATAVLAKIVFDEVPRPGARHPGVPPALDDLVVRMLDKDPARRPRDGSEVAAELSSIVPPDGPPGSRQPSTRPELGAAERRVVGVILASSGGAEDVAVPTEVLRAVVVARHGLLSVLSNGVLAALLPGVGLAEDRATVAAECAAALRTLLPGRPMAISVGRAEAAGERPIGDAIDRAARLLRALGRLPAEVRAAAGIAVDEVAAGLLERRFDLGEGPAGRELRGGRPALESPRTLLGQRTPCVGREREIAALSAVFEECSSSPEARAALVTAPAGFGKSRLAHELLERLYGHAEIWIGRGDPSSAGSSFSLLSAAIKHTAGLVDGDPLPLRREKLRARVARNLPPGPAARVAAFLGEMTGTPFPDDAASDLAAARGDAVLMGDQMRRAWVDFVRAECSWSNVVLLLDDLHWGDIPSLALVDAALATLPARPFMVLGLGRPEVHERFPRLWAEHRVSELRLGGLSPEASANLVAGVLGDALDPDRAAWLVEQADGHPLYLEELIRAAARGHDAPVAETPLAMVEGRIARLDPEARRILRAASVFGETFWAGGVAALSGEAGEIGRRLTDLVHEELLVRRAAGRFAGEEELAFSHGLVREAAYATLTDDDRRLGHRLAGEWLASAGETDAMVLAAHFEAGGDRERAARWYLRATEQAFEGNDLDAVLERAAAGATATADTHPSHDEALGTLELYQAEAHRWRGDLPAAEQHGTQAMTRLVPGSALWFNAAREVILSSDDRLVGLSLRLRAAARDESVAPAQLAALAAAHGRLLAAGRASQAAEILPAIEGFATAVGSLPIRDGIAAAAVHDARAQHAFFTGDAAAFLRNAEAAVARSERAGDLRSAAARRLMVGRVWALLGAYEQAEHVLRAVLPDLARMGLAFLAALGRHHLGVVLGRLGRLEEARAAVEEAVEAFAARSASGGVAVRRAQGAAEADLATILLLLAEEEGPERHARAALSLLYDAAAGRAAVLATLAEILLAERHAHAALTTAHAALALVPAAEGGTPLDSAEARVRLVHVEALAAAGDHAGARAALGEARLSLLARAAALGDTTLRRSFLDGVPEHARTLDLARLAGIPGRAAPPPPSLRRAPSESPESEPSASLREARQAIARNNPDAAITHVERAMNHAAPGEVRAELRALMARAHGQRNAWASAGRWAEQGQREAAPGSRGWLTALSARMAAAAQLGERDEIVQAADALPRLVVAQGSGPAVVLALAALGIALCPLGEASRVSDCFERMERAGAPLAAKDPAVRAWMCRARAERARVVEEDPWTALRLDEAARAGFAEAGDGAEASLSLAHIGVDRWKIGAHERAEESLRSALDAAGHRGHLGAFAAVHLAWTLADAGRLAKAHTSLAVAADPKNPLWVRTVAGAALAEILRRKGDHEGADREAMAALSLPGASPLYRTAILATQAAARLQRGRAAEALDLVRRARAEREALRVHGFREAFVRLVHVEALLGVGDIGGARTPLSRAYARLLVCSSKIGDPALRASFLERIPEHARTLALARQWLGDVSDHAFR